MATYEEIQDWVKKNYGFKPKTCWIAHVKEMCGLKPRVAPNRNDPNKREEPCPDDKVNPIKDSLKHFEMI